MADPRAPVAAPPLSPTSTVDEEAHEIGEKEVCWSMRRQCSLLSYPIFFREIELVTSRARSRCWSLRFTIHSCNHKHREALALWGKKKTLLLFNFSFLVWHGMSWAEPAAAGLLLVAWCGETRDPSKHKRERDRETQRLHCASCLNADNQLEIYMTVLLHCL